MGNYRVIINAVGGHGQDRSKGHDQVVDFEAGGENSPEAIIARAVAELQATGNTVSEATIHHWPGTPSEVVDNLVTGRRLGSF